MITIDHHPSNPHSLPSSSEFQGNMSPPKGPAATLVLCELSKLLTKWQMKRFSVMKGVDMALRPLDMGKVTHLGMLSIDLAVSGRWRI